MNVTDKLCLAKATNKSYFVNASYKLQATNATYKSYPLNETYKLISLKLKIYINLRILLNVFPERFVFSWDEVRFFL